MSEDGLGFSGKLQISPWLSLFSPKFVRKCPRKNQKTPTFFGKSPTFLGESPMFLNSSLTFLKKKSYVSDFDS